MMIIQLIIALSLNQFFEKNIKKSLKNIKIVNQIGCCEFSYDKVDVLFNFLFIILIFNSFK